jgi:hypothetical protein
VSLLAFASVKGAPGVSTAVLALGALWPREVLVADCDPAGGDLSVRLPRADGSPLDPELGLLSLAASARRGLHPSMIQPVVQRLVGGLDVLVGVRTPEQSQVVAPLWPALGSCLDALPDLDVLADCGRLGFDPGQLALLRSARGVVLLCRPTVPSVMHLRERLSMLTAQLRPGAVDGVPIGVVVVADPGDDRSVDGVRETMLRLPTPIPVVGHLAWDPKGAEIFHGQLSTRADRTMLVRSARALSVTLAASIQPFADAVQTTVPGPATEAVPAVEEPAVVQP